MGKFPINVIIKVVKEAPLGKALREECNIAEFSLMSKKKVVIPEVK